MPTVRRVARDVPVGEPLGAFSCGPGRVLVRLLPQPLQRLVRNLRLQPSGRLRPFAQELDARGVREPEEEVIGGLAHGSRARDRGVRLLELGRRVERAAGLARIGVLVLRAALRAFALDVAVRQEDRLHRVVELLDGLRRDERRHAVAEAPVDVLRQLHVLRRVRRVPVIELDVKAVEVLRARGRDLRDQLLRRDAVGVGLQHDRRAVRVVGADEDHFVAAHPLEPHPDVGLDVLHDVADVEQAVRVRQRRRDEQPAAGGKRGGGGRGHRGKPCPLQGKRGF